VLYKVKHPRRSDGVVMRRNMECLEIMGTLPSEPVATYSTCVLLTKLMYGKFRKYDRDSDYEL
jgi:hypothetical protein